jgi:ABC-2 type transport system permease protein
VVDYDHGPQAVKLREAFDAIAANIKTFTTVDYTTKCRRAKTCAPARSTPRWSFPAQYSRRVYAQDAPQARPGCR